MSKDDDSPKEIEARWSNWVFPDMWTIHADRLESAIKDIQTLVARIEELEKELEDFRLDIAASRW